MSAFMNQGVLDIKYYKPKCCTSKFYGICKAALCFIAFLGANICFARNKDS